MSDTIKYIDWDDGNESGTSYAIILNAPTKHHAAHEWSALTSDRHAMLAIAKRFVPAHMRASCLEWIDDNCRPI
jgi:hypothetical protein